MIQRETFSQEGGSEWQLYTLPRAHLVVTGRGRELIETRPEVLKQLNEYRSAVVGRRIGQTGLAGVTEGGVREHLASGGNSDVYTLAPDLAVKEGLNTQSLWFALERMDRLCRVIESGLPRWLDIPRHYGLLVGSELQHQYMLMQKVDAGVTVENVLNGNGSTPTQVEAVKQQFGDLSDQQRDLVHTRFEQAGRLLTDALVGEGLDPEQYMPDWHEGNVLIEPQRVPVAATPFKLWVVDQ